MDNAIIARIGITELPNMKTLNLGNVMGFSVLVSKNVKDGDLGVLFNEGLALSEAFLEANALVRVKQPDGKYKGYFEPTGRVKAVRFNGVKSEAFWIELESLKFTGYNLDKLKDGDNVPELNGVEISHKYYTKATNAARNGVSKRLLRGNTKWFVKHKDTEQFRYYAEQIPEGSTIIITKKLHGCIDAKTKLETKEYGQLTIKEIVDKKIQCLVKSQDIFTKNIEYQPIINHYFLADDEDWYEIELENGQKIVITGNNPVWENLTSMYLQVKDLRVGDELLMN